MPSDAGDVFAALGTRVGARIRDQVVPHVRVATEDSIRQFARAYGDGNPLFCDRAYALASSRGALVAPPLFPIATGTPAPVPADDPDLVDLDRLPGVRHLTIERDDWVLCRPVPEGTALARERRLAGVEQVDESTWDVVERFTFAADGTVHAVHHRHRRYRTVPPPPGRPRPPRASYTPGELDAIDAAYDGWVRQGATPLDPNEVRPGDRLGPMVKGPLTVTDLVEYRAGVGPGPLGGSALALARENRRARPAVYTLDPSGVPDITERRHWDDDYARSLGHPGAYDFSHTRLTWMAHLLTDWVGDGAWLRELSATTALGENHVGDTHWIAGEVLAVGTTAGVGWARIGVCGENQRGERTCEGEAIVLLPVHPSTHVRDDEVAALGADPWTHGGQRP